VLRDSLKLEEKWEIVNMSIEDYSRGSNFDAGILDLPEPWKAAKNLRRLISCGSVLCTYLPTYNQVEKTLEAFSENGFYHIETDEILRRRILVRKGATRPDNDVIGHTAFISAFVRTSGIRS
jgi:tRNA (adenine57-N1/adenine58-N1)-methyltransferase